MFTRCFTTLSRVRIKKNFRNINLLNTVILTIFTVLLYIPISSKFPIHQLKHNQIALKRILKFTLKQLQHVSMQSPSSGSILFELAKVTVVKIIN